MNHALDSEYTPNAATQARAADRARLEKERERAAIRAAQQREAAALAAQQAAQPIKDQAELSEAVAELAARWGLKKKGRKRG